MTAERSAIQTMVDRKVYRVGQDLQAVSGAASDVLSQLPSVDVDVDGNVSLRGDSSVTILVDGKRSAAFAGSNRGLALQQLPASEIDRVEVLTNPPAEFRAEGSGGVINIVTKKAKKPGLSGGTQLSVGGRGRVSASANAAYVNGPLKLNGSVSVRREYRERRTSDARTVTDPALGPPVASSQFVDAWFHRYSPSGRAELEYAVGDWGTLTVSANRRDLTGNRYFDQVDASGAPGAAPSRVSLRHSDGHEWNAEGGEGLSYEQKLWRPGETLTLRVDRSIEHEREGYRYTNTFTLPAGAATFDRLHLSHDLESVESGLDYVLPSGPERQFKAGVSLQEDRNKFDDLAQTVDPATGALLINPNATYDYRFHQRIVAAYGQGQATLGPWKIQTGVRWEGTQVSAQQLGGAPASGRRYSGIYPSLNAERDLSDSTRLFFSASRRLNRPDPEILNPFVDRQDTHNLRAGNPNLRPEDITSAEMGWSQVGQGWTRGLTAYLRSYRDSITNVVTPVAPDVLLSSVANLDKRKAAGLELQATGKIVPQLSYNVSADVFWQQIDGRSLGVNASQATAGVNGKASLEWRPSVADLAQLSISRTDRRLTPQGFLSPINIINFGYRRQLSGNLAAVLTLSDAFDGQRFRRVTATPLVQDVYQREQRGRIVYLGLTWTFNGAKKKGPAFEFEQ